MQKSHLNNLVSQVFDKETSVEKRMEEAFKTAKAISEETTNLPQGMRAPTVSEIMSIEQFGRNYIRQSPKASKRQVRNAIKKAFNIHVLPNTK